jgi:hypothetical protein
MLTQHTEPTVVCSLLGTRQTDLAITCLGSLQRNSVEPVRFQLHDDGSLQLRDMERLCNELKQPVFVSRADADERVAAYLTRYPALASIRRSNPYLLKLLDTVLLSDREQIAFCDTDVYFTRPFSGLFTFPSPSAAACFMMDLQNAYSVRSWHILQYDLRLPRRVNSGLILFRKSLFDLDLLEWFFSRKELHASYFWVEQTAWGLLGGITESWLYDVSQVDIVPEVRPMPEGRIALHFTSFVRNRLGEVLNKPQNMDLPPEAIRFKPTERLTALEMFNAEVSRRVRRYIGKAAIAA